MKPINPHPIRQALDDAIDEVAKKGTEGASDRACLLAGIDYLATIINGVLSNGSRPRTRREVALVGLEKGGPWAASGILLAYFIRSLVGG